jgi:hypothetical protein
MELKSIQRGGSLLEWFAFVALISSLRSARFSLTAEIYLVTALCLGFTAFMLARTLRIKQKKGILEPNAWLLHSRACVLLLSGCQVAIIGLLYLWPLGISESRVSLIAGYLLAGVFMILSYKLVAIAESAKQEGGSSPLSFFGRPRSRRLLFCALIYSPIGPLVLLSLVWSDWKWCPTLLRIPNIWLLLVALLSATSAAMIFQRYRRVAANAANKAWFTIVLVPALLILGFEAVVQVISGDGVYVYGLSSIAILCISATVYWLSLAREERLP